MNFVIGFAFTPDPLPYTRVLMIRKIKPAWQAGKLNGIGGKIDQYVECPGPVGRNGSRLETPIEAMVREFHEETGVLSLPDDWQLYAIMHNGANEHQVFCYESREARLFYDAKTMEAEEIVPVPVSSILHPEQWSLIPNLPGKIMLALDRESWHRPTELIYGGEHFGGKDLKTAIAADPAIDPGAVLDDGVSPGTKGSTWDFIEGGSIHHGTDKVGFDLPPKWHCGDR